MIEAPAAVAEDSPARGWPRTLGTIGIVVGLLMFVDKLADLALVPAMGSRAWWTDRLGEELAAEAVRWLPPAAWVVTASLIGMALGLLLVAGGRRLRRRRRSGVALCRTWAWLAIVWALVEVSRTMWWLTVHGAEIGRLAGGDWQAWVVPGTVLVVAVLTALPIFLLVWFSRPAIRLQLAGWES